MATSERSKRNAMERLVPSKIFQELERNDTLNDAKTEAKLLEQFNSQYATQTNFAGVNEQKYFVNILCFLVKKRLLAREQKLVTLPVLYALRILLRDRELLLVFIQENGLMGLKKQMDLYMPQLAPDLSDSNNEPVSIASNALGGILRILQKVLTSVPNDAERNAFISTDIIQSITRLINYRSFALLPDTLKLILHMIDQSELYTREFLNSEIIDNLFHLLEYKDLATAQLSLHLLATCFSHPEIRRYLPHIPRDYLYTLTSFLTHNNVKVLEHTIWCLANVADNEDDRREIRTTGAIPLLLSLFKSGNRFDFSCPSRKTDRVQSESSSKRNIQEVSDGNQRDQLYDMQSACCNCLAELSYDRTNGQIIIEQNGIYVLAMQLFPENEDLSRLETFNHLQRTAFKTLRFLFPSNEKHDRYQYKRLFPTHIFELFVGIGHFQRDPDAYREITNAWNAIGIDELHKIKLERLEAINPKQEPTRFIRDYGVYECLGSGAFGSVYRVAERGSSTMYALKEINQCSPANHADRSLENMIYEVNIIREKLHHPNVVSYHQLFLENGNVYIRMELIVGSSLQDHLTLLKQTSQKMSEENVWKVFIQLMLALRYLHKEKGIVHRDLTANNIMLDDEYRVKITDFGLAKLRNSDSSKMTSAVGTMFYACPEIIQHIDYNEKADIWSLGCLLYHMLVLVPPFFTPNLLLLATKICAGEYDRTPLSRYSSRIQEIVTKCLVVDQRHRPDICVVAQLCTEELMAYTDRSCSTIQALEKRLRQRETNRESSLLRQQQQQLQHPRCSSCSSLKESSAGNSGGIADMAFEGVDGSHDIFIPVSNSDALDVSNASMKGSNSQHHENLSCPARSTESSDISLESGYDSNSKPPRIHSSSSTSSIERKSSVTSNRSRPSSGSTSVTIMNSRLRPTDPVTQLLDIVHKIMYISYLPPDAVHAKYRRLIDRYRGYLFSASALHNLKRELSKLFNHSGDPIELDTGTGRRPLTFQSSTKSSPSTSLSNLKTVDVTISQSDESVTYEQMMSCIDQILLDTDYAKHTTRTMSSSESLPPIVQKIHRPPTPRK